MSYDDEEKKEKPVVLFYVQGNNYIIKPNNVLKIIKDEYIDENNRFIYTIAIYEPFEQQTIIKWFDEEVRDKEHLILISKFDELGVIFM